MNDRMKWSIAHIILVWYSTYFWIHQGKQILAETLRKSMANGNAQYKKNKSSFLYWIPNFLNETCALNIVVIKLNSTTSTCYILRSEQSVNSKAGPVNSKLIAARLNCKKTSKSISLFLEIARYLFSSKT